MYLLSVVPLSRTNTHVFQDVEIRGLYFRTSDSVRLQNHSEHRK